MEQLRRFEKEAKFLVMLFYAVGITGMSVSVSQPFFLKLVPFALIFSAFILVVFHQGKWSAKTVALFAAILLLGFLIEMVGVNTGAIFGNYSYGESLGVKIANTPLLIGLNWLLLVYVSASVVDKLKISSALKAVLASLAMLTYDIVLEQVAPKIDMWHWENTIVPYQNYAAWFVIAAVFHALFSGFKIKTENRLASTVLLSQFIFFVTLSILLK
ncbi:MAG: carotenoid biosynthesis protein [Bacteroidales bacterium]